MQAKQEQAVDVPDMLVAMQDISEETTEEAAMQNAAVAQEEAQEEAMLQDATQDRRIASKRVHVERVIGLAKTFRILKDELHHAYVPFGGRILFVCFVLTNFRPNLMNNA